MDSCVVFRFNKAIGWQVFDYIEKSYAQDPVKIQTLHNEQGEASLLVIHGQFTQPFQRGRFTKQPHKYLVYLNG